MLNLREEIITITNSPFSSPIGAELLSTVEAGGVFQATLQMNPFAELVREGIVLNELKYAYILAGKEYSFQDLLTNPSCRQLYERLTISLNFLENKLSQHGLIPATDLLRISEFIRTGKELYLQDTAFSDICSDFAQRINDVLEVAYNEHSFINISVICCYLGTNMNIEPLALYVFCSVLINQHGIHPKLPFGICRYFLLEGPFEGQAYPFDKEYSIKAFLRYLKNVFIRERTLLIDIEAEAKNLCQKIREIIPRDSVNAIKTILMSKFSFTNIEIQEAAHVTYRTTLEYIQRLKNAGIIDSVKISREKIHINSKVLSMIERGLSDG